MTGVQTCALPILPESYSLKFSFLSRPATQLNGNIVNSSTGTAIKYGNGLVLEFGQIVCPNTNNYVAQKEFTLPVAIVLTKKYSISVTKKSMGNIGVATRATTFGEIYNNGATGFVGLQTDAQDLNTVSDSNRTVSWCITGFWR